MARPADLRVVLGLSLRALGPCHGARADERTDGDGIGIDAVPLFPLQARQGSQADLHVGAFCARGPSSAGGPPRTHQRVVCLLLGSRGTPGGAPGPLPGVAAPRRPARFSDQAGQCRREIPFVLHHICGARRSDLWRHRRMGLPDCVDAAGHRRPVRLRDQHALPRRHDLRYRQALRRHLRRRSRARPARRRPHPTSSSRRRSISRSSTATPATCSSSRPRSSTTSPSSTPT